jgi:hypothetical protein
MPNEEHSFDDGLGPDPLDRGSAKPLGASGGGGSFIDPSYEDALRILGREAAMPNPWAQQALTMDDAEAADLAARLTRLRTTAGLSTHALAPATEVGKAVQTFIRALQDSAVEPQQLVDMRAQIEAEGGDDVVGALSEVCAHPGVEARFAGRNPGPDLGDVPDLLNG